MEEAKKNNIDFDKPTRQSYIAIAIIIYKLYKGLIRQLFPFLILLFVGRNRSSVDTITITLIIIAVLGSIYGIISFFKYYFHLDEDELIIQKGVFQKKNINIPFERIQTVDFNQNIIHQIFNVVALKIDTAGSSGSEFEFDALSKEKAEALRELIFERKAATADHKESDALTQNLETPSNQTAEPILSLPFGRLLLVGLTENHFRSFGLILIFGFWILDSFEELGYGWDFLEDNIGSAASVVFAGLAMTISVAIFFLILSMLISLVRTILQFFDLKFFRQGSGFKIMSGLITRRERAAMDNKIQIIHWSRNVLQKLLGFFEIHLKQASSIAVNASKSIKVPGASIEQVERVQRYLYKEADLKFDNIYKVSPHFFIRPAIYIIGLALIHITVFIFIEKTNWLVPIILIYGLLILRRYLKYKKTAYLFNDTMLKINGGTFGHSFSLMPIHKIQNIQKRQNYYQRRRNLASVRVYTASGQVGIPYIDDADAEALIDLFTHKVEKSNLDWM